jgi:UDP-3-O-[3-hydroxymyristoyl] glucosamine N-acyltransferase
MWKYPERPSHPRVPNYVKVGKDVYIADGVQFARGGFGFIKENGKWIHIPHSGEIIIEGEVYIGSNTVIARATASGKATYIGSGTKIDALVHIAHNAHIGRHCLIVAMSTIGGSCVLGNNVYIGEGVTVRDHVKIADNVFIGCGSNVVKDCDKAGWVYMGNPAKPVRRRTEDD